MTQHQDEPTIPIGIEFLSLIRKQEGRCEDEFDEWVPSAGVKAPQTLEALGTAVSLLDRIASCWWGCDGSNHLQERLIGRAVSNARASLLLLKTGYYDEGLGLIRQMGETANLLFLFMESSEAFDEWTSANEDERRRGFSAVRVRIRLEQLAQFIPMDEDLYRQLSGLSIHTNPDTTPQGHNPLTVPTMGGYFQEVGALMTLNHLAGLIVFILLFGSTLLQQPADKKSALRATRRLVESIGGLNIGTAEDYWESVRVTTEFKRVEAAMRQYQTERTRVFAAHQSLSETDDSVT